MMIQSLTKVKPFGWVAMIASSFKSAITVFATFDISNQAKAIVDADDIHDYLVQPGTGYDAFVLLQLFSPIIVDPIPIILLDVRQEQL